jgi:organic hydroperoxide reductase OsmC/OhrA
MAFAYGSDFMKRPQTIMNAQTWKIKTITSPHSVAISLRTIVRSENQMATTGGDMYASAKSPCPQNACAMMIEVNRATSESNTRHSSADLRDMGFSLTFAL